jgi:prolyl-tRNA editing enzyme YbaK/EbsC (Cys-tRNA(Pro) deacylase)
MSASVYEAICRLLTDSGVAFEERHHAPTATSEESARARGEELGVGAKALLLRTDDLFRLFVLPADCRIDSKRVKQNLRAKSIRFATPEELWEQTGLAPGAVPPFGRPILPFELFADESVGERFAKVAFNAGSLTDSIIMTARDWWTVANPRRFAFAAGRGLT